MPEEQVVQAYVGKPWQWEKDGCTVTRTTAWSAPGCHEGCQLYVYTNKEGKIVKVEGDPDSPFNQGRLCPRCLAIDEVVYHPQRIIYPMKRDKSERGNNDAWERCTWEEALDLVEKNFREIIEKYGAETIHFQRGTARDAMWQVGRLAYAVGSPNEYGSQSGTSCYLPRLSQMILTMGGQLIADMSAFLAGRYEDSAYVVPSCSIVWGCNPLDSNPDFQLGHWVTENMKRGMKVITVDPRMTWLASRSDIHLALRPGTDAALAMGMVNVLINEDLYDHEFVDEWTFGFDKLRAAIEPWTPEKVAEICWVDVEKIRQAARLFAQAKPANVFWGVAVDMQNSGIGAAQAIEDLFVLTGNVDIPGGMVYTNMPYGISQCMSGGWGMDEFLSEEVRAKRCGVQKYPMYNFGIAHAQPDEALIEAEAGNMHGLWIQTTNTLAGMGDEPHRWQKVMQEVDFCACVDLFMTPTATLCADVFLPVACWPEKQGIRAYYYDVSTINPVIEPQGECKSDLEINLLLGKRFSKEVWPWDTPEEVLDAILKPACGLSWQELREHGPMYPEYTYEKFKKGLMRPDGQPGVFTPSGKFELSSIQLESMGYSPVPYFEEPRLGPVASADLYEEYPFILMTGARTPVFFHTEHRMLDRMRQFNENPTVQMNPKDAAAMGVSTGNWVWLENPHGKLKQCVEVTEMVQEGMVLAQHGWWLPELEGEPGNPNNVFDINVNKLLINAPSVTGFGADRKCVLCKVYPVKEEV